MCENRMIVIAALVTMKSGSHWVHTPDGDNVFLKRRKTWLNGADRPGRHQRQRSDNWVPSLTITCLVSGTAVPSSQRVLLVVFLKYGILNQIFPYRENKLCFCRRLNFYFLIKEASTSEKRKTGCFFPWTMTVCRKCCVDPLNRCWDFPLNKWKASCAAKGKEESH